MRYVLFFLLLTSSLIGEEVRLFDTFLFCNELDMLELRLEEHDSAVDYFVLVEGAKTFTGLPKPLYYELNKERYAKWNHKIIHLAIPDFPEELNNGNAWNKEFYTRNFAMSKLAEMCSPQDLILHSDCDEIVSDDVLRLFKDCQNPFPYCLLADFYYYNCNWKKNFLWNFIFVAQYKDVKDVGLLGMRIKAFNSELRYIAQAGWHLSYFSTPEEIVYKIKSFSHTEMDRPEFTALENVKYAISTGKDLFNRDRDNCIRATENDKLPKNIGILPAMFQRTE